VGSGGRGRACSRAGLKGPEPGPAGASPGLRPPNRRYRDGRTSACALERITGAAAGRWEEAIDELITVLHARAEAVTRTEHDELRAVLGALNMPGEHLDHLLQRS
jgi:hypothetical protein